MKIKNLERAAEIHERLRACNEVRQSLAISAPFTINGISLPHDMAYRIIQVINLEINSLHKEIEDL
jgi:hypothetical protein